MTFTGPEKFETSVFRVSFWDFNFEYFDLRSSLFRISIFGFRI